MMLGNFRTDRNGVPYMKKCKYHCDYGDGENCHYKEEDGCIYNKGRRLTDAESMGMLFDDPQEISKVAIQEVDVKPFHKCIGNEYTLIEDSGFNYCPYCGKKVFWE